MIFTDMVHCELFVIYIIVQSNNFLLFTVLYVQINYYLYFVELYMYVLFIPVYYLLFTALY